MSKPEALPSMQALRAWLAANEPRCNDVLDYNESYVFFRYLEGNAVGSLGRPVTPGRSIATDTKLFPRGALAFLQTERPVRRADGTVEWRPLSRFVLNQDTGGAIRGPVRADFFWGFGTEAAALAGKMKQRGQVWILWPKGRTLPEAKP